ncbi:MAG: hypothetical protein AB1815_07385, partial [Bacillota bacterium]
MNWFNSPGAGMFWTKCKDYDKLKPLITELIRPKIPASIGGGFQRAVKSSMDSANIQRGLNPPLNEVSFKEIRCVMCPHSR